MKKIPLIPADHWFFRNSLLVLKDPLAFFIKTFHEYGDIYDVNSNLFTIYVVANPEYLQEIMVSNKTDYAKSKNYEVLKLSLGKGLLTSEGDFWKKQRRIAQPAFHKESMKLLLDTMVTCTHDSIQKILTKKQIELTDEMNFLTLDIVSKCLFGTTLEGNFDKVQESITIGNEFLAEKIMKPFTAPIWMPTQKNRRYKTARKYSSDLIFDIINKRKEDVTEHYDLLSMLMSAVDEETGEKMNVQQLKDESVTIFVAGHETTANALSWTFYLLSQHPEKLQKLQAEIKEVLKGEAPTFLALRELNYTTMVLEEAMRLYPPAWSIGRKVAQDTVMFDYEMKKDAEIIIDVYTLHRHPGYWENPNDFIPERFDAESKKQRHKYAYMPFGAGKRMCIGNNFAMMEMQIILVMFLQNFNLKLAANAPKVEPEPLITLRPRNGMLMEVLI